ncbi:hypothetical protein MHBO_001390 [Bonamia ostreae]|uniref:PHD-type domain-containing protein n=1 Tax=Bonamia ostreae TaxID=126728 RepID=A0ABV2AJB4_9EUKA
MTDDDSNDSIEFLGESTVTEFKTEIAKVPISLSPGSSKNKFVLTELIVLTDDEDAPLDENNSDDENNVNYVDLNFNDKNEPKNQKVNQKNQKTAKTNKKVQKNDKNEQKSSENDENSSDYESYSTYSNEDSEDESAEQIYDEYRNDNQSEIGDDSNEASSSEEDYDEEICSLCKKVGENLLSCKTCPVMYHKKCSKFKQKKKGVVWICPECEKKKTDEIEKTKSRKSVQAAKFPKLAKIDVIDGFQILSFPSPSKTASNLPRNHEKS